MKFKGMRHRYDLGRIAAVIMACASFCLVPGHSSAQAPDTTPTFAMKVIVANLTNTHDKIDKEARRLDKELRSQFRYEGIRVLDSVDLVLKDDEVMDLKLPSRRRLRIRPLVIEKGSALISVEISGLVQSDLKVKAGQLVIIGAEKFGDGKLVIAIDASH